VASFERTIVSEETSEPYALYSTEELTRLLYWLQHCRDGQLRHLPDLVSEVRAEITQRRRGADAAIHEGDPHA
jgi:hypothetical protein